MNTNWWLLAPSVIAVVITSLAVVYFAKRSCKEPVQYAGGTSAVLCEKFGGLKDQRRHDIFNTMHYDSETVVATCNDGSEISRTWMVLK